MCCLKLLYIPEAQPCTQFVCPIKCSLLEKMNHQTIFYCLACLFYFQYLFQLCHIFNSTARHSQSNMLVCLLLFLFWVRITPLLRAYARGDGVMLLLFACYGKFLRTLLANGTHRSSEVTVAVVPTYVVRIEVQVIGVAAVVRVKRTRPIAAVTARTAETAVAAMARSRKKYRVTVYFTCYFISVYSVLGGPCPSAVACTS